MLGFALGLALALVCGGLAWRSLPRMTRNFDAWRVAFRSVLAEPASDRTRATHVDELLSDLARALDADQALAASALRLALLAGAVLALGLALNGAWAEGLRVVPGALLGASSAAWFGRLRERRSQALRETVDQLVLAEASGLCGQAVSLPLRSRRRSQRRR